jgi:hypothetical protein
MRATRWLAGVLGWVPTVAVAALLLLGVVVGEIRFVPVPWIDFLLSAGETIVVTYLLVAVWSQRRRELAATVHPRKRSGAVAHHDHRTAPAPQLPSTRAALGVGVVVMVVLFGLYLVRPLSIIHGPLWLVDKYPLVWLVTALAGGLVGLIVWRLDRYVRRLTLVITMASAWLVTLVPMAWLAPKLSALATYHHYKYIQITRLPSGGEVRVVPREVAEQVASIGYNRSGHGLGRGHMILDPQNDRLTWSFEQAPNGVRNVLFGFTEGIALLDAQETNRTYHQIDSRFKLAPGMEISDNTSWKIYKDSYFSVPTDAVPVITKTGVPEFVVPVLSYEGWPVKYPVVSKVYVFHADGRIERLSVAQAKTRTDIVDTGRLIPQGLAREIQDAYAFKHGIWNTALSHNDQTQIVDSSDSDNHQPYLMAFSRTAQGKPLPAGEKERLYWVSSDEPRGQAFATKAIFLTDAITGTTYVWSVPIDTSLTGANQAVQDAKSLAIPGIVFEASYETGLAGAGRYQVVEPRPVFVNGRLQYLMSIIPTSHNNVTKSVVVDATSNKVVALFNNDTDPSADSKLVRYLRTGVLDRSAAASPEQVGQPGATTPVGQTPTTTTSTSAAGKSLAQLLAANAKLLRQVRENQQAIEQLLRKQKKTG